MAPRPRRAASQKQSQYRISDEDEDSRLCTTPVNQKVGGILASLSHNVPVVKSRKITKKSGEEISKAETIESSGVSIFATPPPPTSVFVGNNNELCSPLTQPRVAHVRYSFEAADISADDNTTAISCETFSPDQKGTILRKPVKKSNDISANVGDDASEDIGSDDEDDDTAEMDENDDDPEVDPNETILEAESSEESDDEIESAEDDSEEEIELETEDDDEEYEPDDEEYVPDEEEESALDEELDSYVEEESTKTRSRNQKPKQALVQSQASTNESILSHSDSPCNVSSTSHNIQTNIVCQADTCGEIATTPSKTEDKSVCMDSSPEPAMAVIVDDDDDSDDDVLVATILDDDDEDRNGTMGDKTGQMDVPEGDHDDAAVFTEDACNDQHVDDCGGLTCHAEEKREKEETAHFIEQSKSSRLNDKKDTKAKVNAAPIAPSGHSVEPSSDSKSSGNVVAVTETELKKTPQNSEIKFASEVGSDDKVTPQKKTRKARKSFFRSDGMVKRGKWKLGSKIGVGSFGVVHVGMNNETGKLMAVKKFKVDEAVMQDIRREVELMKSLNHPNIVRYLGAEMDKTHLHIFQEWVPGGSVATLLARFGPFSLSVIRSYLCQTLSGLAYLHENDIMHRDIKGSNILVNDEGVVKLADFGASKKLSNLRDNMLMSLTVRGTPYFMSPEVFEEKYSAKADVWGIGCVAYQMITGSPPWKDKGFSNPISLFNHIKKHKGPPNIGDEHKERLLNEDRNIYSWLNSFLESCFSKDPMARPDASDLIEHQFFTEMHEDADDDSICSRGLFSPVSAFKSTPKHAESPEEASQMLESPSPSPRCPPVPTPVSQGRSKSVVQWRTTFSSPPRQKNGRANPKKNKAVPRPTCSSPYNSPKPDVNNWPDWARTEIEKRTLFEKSPNKEVISPVTQDSNLSAMMGSLALSEDSGTVGDNPYRRTSNDRISTIGTTNDESKLVGLSLLNESNITYEI